MSHALDLIDRNDALRDFSVEVTSKDALQLAAFSSAIPKGTVVSIPYLPNETDFQRIAASRAVRLAGCVPMPHIAARRLSSATEFSSLLSGLVTEGHVNRLLIIAGDVDPPKGPFEDTAAILRSGILEHHGITHVSIAGHPEGHPAQDARRLREALLVKQQILEKASIDWAVFTQFAFASAPVLTWIDELRRAGIDVPIHVGIPGPATVKTLLKFAAVCGVSASAAVLRKYGLSITQLLSTAGPDVLVREYAEAFRNPRYGHVRLHLYPFGGLGKCADWLTSHHTVEPLGR